MKKVIKRFFSNNSMLIIFIIGCLIIPFKSEYFLTRTNLENIINQSAILGIMAMGMISVLLSGHIDISVGALLGLSGVLSVKLFNLGAPLILVFIIPVLAIMLMSLVSAILITKLHLNSFVITLGIMFIARGFIYVITQENTLTNIAHLVLVLGSESIYSIPILSIILFVLTLVMYIFIHKTRMGLHIQAVGGNVQTAREWGLNPEIITILAFVISGIFTGIAGILYTGRMMSAGPQAGLGLEFQVIGAFVLGGGVLFFGEGNVLKTILGVFVFSIINNGMNLLRILAFTQIVVRGIIIIIVVGMSSFLYRKK